ncbi:hypothetical protein RZ760_005635 [Providencia rettgeri]|nr:hypothetical protein [Providencia rettgeri]
MSMTLQERKAQLSNKQVEQGLGGNITIGGDATNNGHNKGIIEGGEAHDSGLGNGGIKGGEAINNNHNIDTIEAGSAINRGENNGSVEGGDSTNSGINNNALLGGKAHNAFGSLNAKNSYIKAGNAIRELQNCVDVYDGHQKQLAEMKKKYEEIKQSFEEEQSDASSLSIENKEQYEVVLKEKNEEIKKLNEIIKSDLQKIDSLVTDLSEKDSDIQRMSLQLESVIVEKNKLELKVNDVNLKLDKATKRIEELKTNINNKQDKITEIELQLADETCDRESLNKEIQSLQEELDVAKNKLQANYDLISRREARITELSVKITKMETQYSLKSQEVSQKLNELLEQIAVLANEGKNELPEISADVTSSKQTELAVSLTEVEPAKVVGGNAGNSGINAGTIKAGDSNSQSVVVNTEINVHADGVENSVVSKISESMSSLISKTEGVVQEGIESVSRNIESSFSFVADRVV